MAKRYVIQVMLEHVPGQNWDDLQTQPVTTPKYVKLGGGYTEDLSEANIIGWRSVQTKWSEYIESGDLKAVEVNISIA